jgi:hypothetical protein
MSLSGFLECNGLKIIIAKPAPGNVAEAYCSLDGKSDFTSLGRELCRELQVEGVTAIVGSYQDRPAVVIDQGDIGKVVELGLQKSGLLVELPYLNWVTKTRPQEQKIAR